MQSQSPNRNLDPRKRVVTVTTANGQILTGLARNEDNFSLQLQTTDGAFHLLNKSEMQKIEYQPRSLMPDDYASRLSSKELDDLVSYLVSIARNKNKPEVEPGMKRESTLKMPSSAVKSRLNRSVRNFLLLCLAGLFGTTSVATGADQPKRDFKLVAESPKFWRLFDRKAKLSTVATGFGFTEGPVWDESGFLYVSDESQNKIYRVFLDGRKEDVISLGDPDGNTYDRQAPSDRLRERSARHDRRDSGWKVHRPRGPLPGNETQQSE